MSYVNKKSANSIKCWLDGFLGTFCPPCSCLPLSRLSRRVRVGLFWKRFFFSKVWSVSEISLGHKACSLVFWYDWTNSFPRRALKIQRSVSAPKCQFSPAGQNLIQPLLEPFEHNLNQNNPIKSLFQARISALGSRSALGNRTVFTLIKCHIRPKNRTVFCSPKRPQLAPVLRLKQIFLVYSVCKLCVLTLHTVFSMSNFLTRSTVKFYCLT